MLIMAPSICSDLWEIWQIIGYVLLVFKIVIPLIIIIFGAIDLGKAVVASKDDEIKKSIKSLVIRAISGIIIFFIPTLVGLIFRMVGSFNEAQIQNEYKVCSKCITNPSSCDDAAAEACTQSGKVWNADTHLCESQAS